MTDTQTVILLLVRAKTILKKSGLDPLHIDDAIEYVKRIERSIKEVDTLINNTIVDIKKRDRIDTHADLP